MRVRPYDIAAVAAAWFAFGVTTACAQQAEGSFNRTLSVATPIEVDVTTGSGRIDVRRGSSDQVVVSGRVQVWGRFWRDDEDAEEIVARVTSNPPIELSGGTVRIGYIEDEDVRRNVSISYEITVPAEASVRARSGSGNQSIAGVDGAIDVSTGSGGITLTDIGGGAEAHTGSGSIEASGIAGAFMARTGSGSVTLAQTGAGDVTVETGSGSSRLTGVDGALRVRAGSGSIEVEGTPRGTWSLETGSGSITLELPDDAAFDIEAETGSGGIRLGRPVEGTVREGRVSGDVGGGGPLLTMRTGSGGIRID